MARNSIHILCVPTRRSDRFLKTSFENQSGICGKGVGLGLFPSDSLESQSFELIEIAHTAPYYGVENDCRKFRSNRMEFFLRKSKKAEKWLFFWLFLG